MVLRSVLGVGVALLAVTACIRSEPEEAPPTVPTSAVDFRRCEGFLSLLELQTELDEYDLVRRSVDMTQSLIADNPAIQESCIVGFESPRKSRSIALNATKFHSAISAGEHAASVIRNFQERWGGRVQIGFMGPDSYQLVLNQEDVGSLVGFRKGPYTIQLRTLYKEDVTPLVEVDQLANYAEVVRSRLPD